MKLFQQENCVEITLKLLTALNVKVTSSTLEQDISYHPEYPSLLSISDILAKYGVENISVKTHVNKLHKLPLPCLVPIKSPVTNSDFFSIINKIDSSGLTYYEPEKNRWQYSTFSNFETIWPTGIALFTDTENAHGEKDYHQHKYEENRKNITTYICFLVLPLFTLFTIIWGAIVNDYIAIMPSVYLLLTLTGTIIGGLLLIYEIDKYNPVLRQICSAGKKINCAAILNSKASKILGVSWSAIGFIYFTGNLLLQMLIGLAIPVGLYILTWLNIMSIPFIFCSIYYQWQIAKQWCALCLWVQGILVLQLITALANGWHELIEWNIVLTVGNLVLLAFILPFIALSSVLPVLKLSKENKRNIAELKRLKHNPQIFEALLYKQKRIAGNSDGLGILLGNLQANNKIVKVCNPYCEPCASAHQLLDELLHSNPDLQLQIIFTAKNNEGDIKTITVKHLLAIAENNNQTNIMKALDDWYLAKNKDYKLFAEKYPMHGELEQQDVNVEAMNHWCHENQISFTPTFFVNGYQMPDIYSINDLNYLVPI